MQRRIPLLTSLLWLFPLTVFAFDPSVTATLPNGISSGDTTQNSTVLWTRSAVPGDVRFEVANSPQFARPLRTQTVSVEDPSVPAKAYIEGLRPGARYFYRVTSPEGEVLTGSFRTAAAADSRQRNLVFGVSGDWRGELAPYPAIRNAAYHNLDFFVKLGDTIYADYPSPAVPAVQAQTLADYRAKHTEVYAEHYGMNTWAALQARTSIFSIIDDHEVINDFAGGAEAVSDPRFIETSGLINETSLYKSGLQAFVEYNAIADLSYAAIGDALTDARPDLYRAQRYGTLAEVFMLDARSFRDAELSSVTNPFDPLQIGTFIAQSFDIDPFSGMPLPARTLLSERQLERVKQDLLAAEQAGVTWKFVMVPEPIQNLGVVGAGDRFEGYATERSELLQFIDEQGIRNVVFVAADIHGTLVNNLTYQRHDEVLQALATYGNPLAAPQIETSAFEISTGSVAFDPPFGPTILGLLTQVPGGTDLLALLYQSVGVSTVEEFMALPDATRNTAMQGLVDQQLVPLGYSPVGLDDASRINASLTQGLYTATFSFGWTEFNIQADSRALRVTTYGIDPYSEQELLADPEAVSMRRPQIVSEFVVTPEP